MLVAQGHSPGLQVGAERDHAAAESSLRGGSPHIGDRHAVAAVQRFDLKRGKPGPRGQSPDGGVRQRGAGGCMVVANGRLWPHGHDQFAGSPIEKNTMVVLLIGDKYVSPEWIRRRRPYHNALRLEPVVSGPLDDLALRKF